MSAPCELATAFATAFNRHDVDGMIGLLHEDATAEVLGSGFPEERGVNDIRKKSFPHLLDEAESAVQAEVQDNDLVFLRRKQDGALDVAIRIHAHDGKIARIEYLVTHFRRDELVRLAGPRGIVVAPPEE